MRMPRDRLGLQGAGGRFDAALQFAHENAALQPAGNGRKDLQSDAAGMPEKGVAAPKQPRIEGHRDHRNTKRRVEQGDAGVVFSGDPRWVPVAYGKNDHLSAFGNRLPLASSAVWA